MTDTPLRDVVDDIFSDKASEELIEAMVNQESTKRVIAALEGLRMKLSPVNGMWDWNAAVKELDAKIDAAIAQAREV